jgi:hypothetical protein
LKISLVLFRQRGQIDVGVGKIDTLAGGDISVVAGTSLNVLLVLDAQDVESEDTIVNVDDTARLNDLGDVLVVDIPGKWLANGDQEGDIEHEHVVGVASRLVLLISGDVDDLASGDRKIIIIGSVASTDLRALCVEGNGDGAAILDLDSLSGVVDNGLVVLI